MRKKILTVFMSMIMFMTCIPTTIYAEENYIPTDVETPREDCTFYAVPGSYVGGQQEALDLMNEIRYKACANGVLNPKTREPLTMDDYVPLQWSYYMEYIARIRAAEAALTLDHVRTNGDPWKYLRVDRFVSDYELLASPEGEDMVSAVKYWQAEESRYIANISEDPTVAIPDYIGHYAFIIDPTNTYVGIGTFVSACTNTSHPNSTAAEFKNQKNVELYEFDTKSDMIGEMLNCYQILEIKNDSIEINPAWELIEVPEPAETPEPTPTPEPSPEPTPTPTPEPTPTPTPIPECTHEHASGYITKDSTCSATGIKTYSCPDCLKVLKRETVAKKPHTYNIYGKCKNCGALATNVSTSVSQTKIRSVSKYSGAFKVRWNKNSKVKGYQIRYSTSPSMSNAKTVKITKYKTTSKKITKLKKKTKYYIQIRSYKTISGKTKYSLWSAVRSVTTN